MAKKVKKREIFYLGGYDPRGARSYYNLYKTESEKNAKIDELDLVVERRRRENKHIQSCIIKNVDNEKNVQVEVKYNFLEWDDIIREKWKKSFGRLFLDMFVLMRRYYLSGVILKTSKLSLQTLKPMLFPTLYIIIMVLTASILSMGIVQYLAPILTQPLALFISLIFFYFFIKFTHKLGDKIAVFWTMKSILFYGNYLKSGHEKLDERLDYFSEYVNKSIQDKEVNHVDELLIIAHSAGTVLLIELIHKIVEKNNQQSLEKISILTLGHCIPLVSLLPDAFEYRDKMSLISQYPLNWIDISSPADEISFALVDYFNESGVSANHLPTYLSPKFHTLFDAKKYKKIKRDVFLLHFLYIMATDKIGTYNYFQITAGNEYLLNRFKGDTK